MSTSADLLVAFCKDFNFDDEQRLLLVLTRVAYFRKDFDPTKDISEPVIPLFRNIVDSGLDLPGATAGFLSTLDNYDKEISDGKRTAPVGYVPFPAFLADLRGKLQPAPAAPEPEPTPVPAPPPPSRPPDGKYRTRADAENLLELARQGQQGGFPSGAQFAGRTAPPPAPPQPVPEAKPEPRVEAPVAEAPEPVKAPKRPIETGNNVEQKIVNLTLPKRICDKIELIAGQAAMTPDLPMGEPLFQHEINVDSVKLLFEVVNTRPRPSLEASLWKGDDIKFTLAPRRGPKPVLSEPLRLRDVGNAVTYVVGTPEQAALAEAGS